MIAYGLQTCLISNRQKTFKTGIYFSRESTNQSAFLVKEKTMKFLVLSSIFLSCFLVQANQADKEKQAELNKRLDRSLRNILSMFDIKEEEGEEGSIANIKKLLKAGADPNARDEEGRHLLVKWHHYPEVFKILLEHGADPNATITEQDRRTALHFTTNPSSAKVLLEHGADPNARDSSGATPLHGIQGNRDPKMVRVLLEGGADPNAQDSSGNTPLHKLRVDEKGIVAARFLISSGADPKLKNHNGNIPFIVQTAPLAFKQKKETACKYITESSKIKPAQCGQRDVCISEVSCTFTIGHAPNTAQIERTFQAVCSSFPNGKCPKANDCVLDRSVVESKGIVKENYTQPAKLPVESRKAVQ